MDKIRKIIHIDMDAYYAAIEVRDNPSLKGLPVVVGGSPDSRGVVSTANYEARRYGIHSAMSSAEAYRRCPFAIFLPPRFDVYKKVSIQIMNIFCEYTDLIEPMSLDEAYLDVTQNKIGIKSATAIAREIKAKIHRATGLTSSAGVSYNKFLAKVASDYKKPDGLTVIPPAIALNFIDNLPVGKFYGVGKATEKRMLAMGIRIGADLRNLDIHSLISYFGKAGAFYYYIVRGIDNRKVNPDHIRKSIGAEQTFPRDLVSLEDMKDRLFQIAREVERRMVKNEVKGKTVTLKVRYDNFARITRSRSLRGAVNDAQTIFKIASELLLHTEAGRRRVRLLGISISSFEGEGYMLDKPRQPELPFAYA